MSGDPDTPGVVWIDVTNHRGERSRRLVLPLVLFFGSDPWHPEPQWLLSAYCFERRAKRTFAMGQIHGWEPESSPEPGAQRP